MVSAIIYNVGMDYGGNVVNEFLFDVVERVFDSCYVMIGDNLGMIVHLYCLPH